MMTSFNRLTEVVSISEEKLKRQQSHKRLLLFLALLVFIGVLLALSLALIALKEIGKLRGKTFQTDHYFGSKIGWK